MSDRSLVGPVLLTGAGGFLGSYIASHLLASGREVVGVGSDPAPPGIAYRYVQMRLPDPDIDALVAEIRPTACIHCAGRASVGLSVEDPVADFQAGPAATLSVLDALRRLAPRTKFVFLSSASVYGNPEVLPIAEVAPLAPISPYGYHKRITEDLCREYRAVFGLPTLSVRLFSAYGVGLRRQVVWDICRKALDAPVIELFGDGQETRDFIHASDVARAVVHLLGTAPFDGEAWNLATGRSISIQQLSQAVLRALGMSKEVRFNGRHTPGDPRYWQADVDRLLALGFRPAVSIEEGVREYAAWVAGGAL